ncbi:MAG: FHA domain-containing protein [Verrucomicrobia bacterium]|nr:FHA domain-containing protein [Verrucomicrobiota bacterium]
MARLIIKGGGGVSHQIELKAGTNRLGRSEANDHPIHDESISGVHCEITLADGSASVIDLGSTNGTFLNSERIEGAALNAGDVLRLGNVEMVYQEEGPARIAHRASAAPLRPVPRIGAAPASDRLTFFGALPGALTYPFKQNGPILLVCGTIFFMILNGAAFFASFAPLFGLAALLILAIGGGGYLFSYMQGIIVTSANGDEAMPAWPEISSLWDDLVLPFFRYMTIWLICFMPGVLAMVNVSPVVGYLVLLLGVFCLPMAMLAVAMADSITGLNPLVIFSAIAKLPGAYLVACLALLVVVAIAAFFERVMGMIHLPLLPTIVASFLSLYWLTVEMRIIGLLYYTNKEKLGWFA